jgi:hypothetical protein
VSEPEAHYVYGVVDGDADARLFDGVAGVGSGSVHLVSADRVAAIVGPVPLDEFGEEPLSANVEQPEWLAAQARAHDRVLAQAVGRTALVPFRFGTVYVSEAHVRELLRARSPQLTAELERLRGRVELGVKAFAPAAEPAPVATTPASGRDYLLLRQRERARTGEAAAAAREQASAVHERLAALAEDARANPPQHPELSGRREPMLLNGAYLVPVERQDTFAAAVDELQGGALELELTGPWPPYNFVEEDA